MNIKQLLELIVKLPDDLPVCVEVSFDDGDALVGSNLRSVNVEARCDDIECLYLCGDEDQDKDSVT